MRYIEYTIMQCIGPKITKSEESPPEKFAIRPFGVKHMCFTLEGRIQVRISVSGYGYSTLSRGDYSVTHMPYINGAYLDGGN